MLKSGIMKDYHFEATEMGSGQGSICSPILRIFTCIMFLFGGLRKEYNHFLRDTV